MPSNMLRNVLFPVALTLGSVASAAQAPAPSAALTPETQDVTALAKATQNPVADIVSLPFQFNFNNGGNLRDQTFLNLNFQPVIPIKLTDDWILISRTIVPVQSLQVLMGQGLVVSAISSNSSISRPRGQALLSGALAPYSPCPRLRLIRPGRERGRRESVR